MAGEADEETGTEGGRLHAVGLHQGIGEGVPDDPDHQGLDHDPGIGGGEGLDQALDPLDEDSSLFTINLFPSILHSSTIDT